MIVALCEDDGERKKGEEGGGGGGGGGGKGHTHPSPYTKKHSKKAKDWLILNKTFTTD